MPSPNTIQDRRRDHIGGRQSGGHDRGGDDEGDDAQPLGFQNLAGERVFKLRRQSAPWLALNELADKCLHGASAAASATRLLFLPLRRAHHTQRTTVARSIEPKMSRS